MAWLGYLIGHRAKMNSSIEEHSTDPVNFATNDDQWSASVYTTVAGAWSRFKNKVTSVDFHTVPDTLTQVGEFIKNPGPTILDFVLKTVTGMKATRELL